MWGKRLWPLEDKTDFLLIYLEINEILCFCICTEICGVCFVALQVKVDLVALAQQCCPDLNLKAELDRSILSEPTSPGHSKPAKGFRLGKHKHETFITSRYTQNTFTCTFIQWSEIQVWKKLCRVHTEIRAITQAQEWMWLLCLTCLKEHTQGENIPGFNLNRLNTAYVKVPFVCIE